MRLMPFVVPKFIERKPKIIGPLTFQQFIFIGIAGAICFFLYFTFPFHIFLIATIVLLTGAIFFTFGKIKGIPIPTLIKNFFAFFLSNKMYLWEKRGAPQKIIKVQRAKAEKEKRTAVLDIAAKSKLKNLSAKIETGQR